MASLQWITFVSDSSVGVKTTGDNESGQSAELFDPVTNTFAATEPIHSFRYYGGAVSPSDSVLVMGGGGSVSSSKGRRSSTPAKKRILMFNSGE